MSGWDDFVIFLYRLTLEGTMQFKILKIAALLIFLLVFAAYAKASPAQPEQSESHTDLACFKPKHRTVNMFHYGKGDYEYWLFEPANPKPYRAPLIVFNHGWMSTSPESHGAWIDHIVKRGNIMVFPVLDILQGVSLLLI